MNVKYHDSFSQDLDGIEKEKDLRIVERAINQLKEVSHTRELPNVKKLQGVDNAYRIRAGNYRIGFYLDGETVIISRVAHRNVIYQLFP